MKKRIISILLVTCMLTGLVTGCGQKETESSKESEGTTKVSESNETKPVEKEEKEIPTLRILAGEHAKLTQDLNDNATVQYMEKELGINLEFECVPKDALVERITLAITSNEMPDILYLAGGNAVLTTDDLLKYGQSGVFVPIDEMMEENFPNLYHFLTETTDGMPALTEADGHIYSTPNVGEPGHMQHAVKTWVNQMFLDALGMDMPETLEEFEVYLKAVKEQDVNGNGDPNDEVGLVGMANDSTWFHFLMNSFVYVGSDRQYGALLYQDNASGEVLCSNVQEGYREGLRYINSLWEQGLIYEETMTMSQDQLKVLYMSEVPVIGALGYFAPFVLDLTMETPTYAQLNIMAPLSNDGKQGMSPWSVNGADYQITPGAGIITSACENVEAAARFLDWHYAPENQRILSFGPDWETSGYIELAEEGEVDLYGAPAHFRSLDAASLWANNISLTDFMIRFNLKSKDGKLTCQTYDTSLDLHDPAATTALLQASTDLLHEYAPEEYSTIETATRIKPENAQMISDIKEQLKTYSMQWDTEFIMGNKSLDDDWQEYVDGLYELGLQTVIDEYQAALN